MIITLPWLKEHLQTKANQKEIIEKLTNIKHYELLEDLAESIFKMIFNNKLVKKINLKIDKIDILKQTKSVGIDVTKSKI